MLRICWGVFFGILGSAGWVGAQDLNPIELMLSEEPSSQIQLQFSQAVPSDQKKRLQQDLDLLTELMLIDRDGEMKRIFKLSEITPSSVEQWLLPRAHVVLDENHPIDLTTIQTLEENVTYPDPNVIPWNTVEKITGRQNSVQDQPTDGPRTIMSNMGGLLYLYGKQSKALVGLDVQGMGVMPVRSPRVGIFMIGAGLFEPLAKDLPPSAIQDRVHAIARLGTLMHESRHSDGHAKSLLFSHALCPAGHAYAGLPACDTPANGSYRIEALFLRAAKDGCPDCSAEETERLSVLQLDAESRVLNPGPVKTGSSDPNDPQLDLCQSMKKMGLKADFCEAEAQPAAPVEWDDEPESL